MTSYKIPETAETAAAAKESLLSIEELIARR